MSQRLRNFCFTINNYTIEDIENCKNLSYSYLILGKEIGEKGTPHIQGYCELKGQKRFDSIIKHFKHKAHIEQRKGTAKEASDYCKKDNNYEELGTLSSPGARTDLKQVCDDILKGKKVDDITIENPFFFHQYGRTLQKVEDIRNRNIFRNFMTEGIWYHGKTGCGKSETAFKNYDPKTHYVWKYEKNDWQDGYTGQEIVIIDEFRGQLPFSTLLRMIDKHPNCDVSRRGKEPFPFISKKVIITSALRPEEIYYNLHENDKLEQLLRRLKIIDLSQMSQKCSEGNTKTSEPNIKKLLGKTKEIL